MAALFYDGLSTAISASGVMLWGAAYAPLPAVMTYFVDSWGLTARTFRVRAGLIGGTTGILNSGVTNNYGTAPTTTITITEYDPLASFTGTDKIPAGTYGDIRVPTTGVFNVQLADNAPSTPPSNTVRLFRKSLANRQLPAFVGPTGLAMRLQPFQGSNKVGTWSPGGNATTVPAVDAFNAPTALGTATARNVASTNMATRSRRLGYVSAATAAAMAGHYNVAAGTQFSLGDGAGLGGFFYVCRFVPSDAANVSGARMLVGLRNAVAAPTNVDPAAGTNQIGVAQLAASNNLQIVYGGSAAQTAIDLGVNFPANTLSADLYELALFAPPGSNNTVYYEVTRLNTGHVASGTLTGTAGTALPASTTFLGHVAWRTNNATALAVGIDVVSVYIETDN